MVAGWCAVQKSYLAICLHRLGLIGLVPLGVSIGFYPDIIGFVDGVAITGYAESGSLEVTELSWPPAVCLLSGV